MHDLIPRLSGQGCRIAYPENDVNGLVNQSLYYVAPVRLVADWDVLRLFEVESGELSVGEQHQLIDRLSPLFAERGMELRYHDDLDWRLHHHAQSTAAEQDSAVRRALCTTPLQRVAGANVHDFMPQGEGGLFWRQLLNEVQMALHTAEIDPGQRQITIPPREMRVNGVWIWREASLAGRVVDWGRTLFQRQ